jgi:hypothetical protein
VKFFKIGGLWTVYWTDYSRLERAQCIMWLRTVYWTDYSRLERAQRIMWLRTLLCCSQQTAEGAVHNVAVESGLDRVQQTG